MAHLSGDPSPNLNLLGILFGFNGRIGRLVYFAGMILAHLLLGLAYFAANQASDFLNILSIVKSAIFDGGPDSDFALLMVAGLVAIVVYVWMYFALQVKRWHDLGQTGALALLSLCGGIPVVGWVITVGITISLIFIAGTYGPNRFGPRANAKGHPRLVFGRESPSVLQNSDAGQVMPADPSGSRVPAGEKPRGEALHILRGRLVRGEITPNEYRRMKTVLEE